FTVSAKSWYSVHPVSSRCFHSCSGIRLTVALVCGSRSMTSTRLSCSSARKCARARVMVVLPTPPLRLMMLVTIGMGTPFLKSTNSREYAVLIRSPVQLHELLSRLTFPRMNAGDSSGDARPSRPHSRLRGVLLPTVLAAYDQAGQRGVVVPPR